MRRSNLLDREERRDLTLAAARVEIRADDEGGNVFVGHAAVFDQRTAIGNPLTWGFYEQIAPGAFTKTLDEGDARMLIDHDSYYVVSRVSAETLRLVQDKVGLAVDSDLDVDLSYVADLKANLRNGNITGMSFGFYPVKDRWDTEEVETSDGHTATVEIRTLLEVRLMEVSAVTFPAYEGTDAGLRKVVYRALRNRADRAAIQRRTQYLPELAELLDDVTASEPGESTRDDGDGTTTDEVADTEPADATRMPTAPAQARERARAVAARFGLTAA